MRRAASESAAAPVSHNAAGPVELNDVCRTKLKLPYQTDSDAALLPNLIHQLGSAHEWSGVWIRPKSPRTIYRSSDFSLSLISSCNITGEVNMLRFESFASRILLHYLEKRKRKQGNSSQATLIQPIHLFQIKS